MPFALAGETVVIEEKYKTKHKKWGKLIAVEEKSPNRKDPECSHFTTCGGCLLQHFDDSSYKDFKLNLVKNALIDAKIDDIEISDPIIVGKGQRRRIDFMARKWDGEIRMGFHEAESKKPFNIKECPLVHQDIPPLFQPLRQVIAPIIENHERLVHFFITKADNGIDVLLAGFKQPLPAESEQELINLAKEHGVIRLAYKVKKREKVLHQTAIPTVRFGDHDVEVTAFGFLQATSASDQIFAEFLNRHLNSEKPQNIVDLFCGRGTLSLALTKNGHSVTGFECDGQALSALRKIKDENLQVFDRNLFEEPLTADELNEFDTVVMNPPRAGAATQTLEIAKSNVKNLVYISCNPQSFARDLQVLLENGFKVQELTPLDQFMWTPHIEVMAFLTRE